MIIKYLNPSGCNQVYSFTAEDLVDQGEIGRGAYGTVNKMYHEASGTIMAVKVTFSNPNGNLKKPNLNSNFYMQRIRSTVDEKEQSQLLMDLQVVMKSNDCPFIVKFYGALFKEVCVCHHLIKHFYKFAFSDAGRLLDLHGADVNILG